MRVPDKTPETCVQHVDRIGQYLDLVKKNAAMLEAACVYLTHDEDGLDPDVVESVQWAVRDLVSQLHDGWRDATADVNALFEAAKAGAR